MKEKKVAVAEISNRRIRKNRVVGGAITLLLSIIVFCTIQVKDGFASNENELVNQEVIEKESYERQTVIEEKEEEMINYFVYNEDIPMPKEHQFYLFNKAQERELEYEKTLALIETESGFRSTVISDTKDFGYFQINRINHEYLAETLNTRIIPLDPYINIDWGTYMLSTLYDYWKEKGITGKELDHYVWSSYNKGITGFKKYGKAVQYVSRIQSNLNNSSY
ncbi:transglycosylase SLT domain-containing protein [Virgibacillus halodenitrificans]|uniref:transglycosylase SLT domain-containing protein n=1 Tax=Virgibacillus halodenitrificans TaxID=1482 RepID=UPI0013CE511B|nr:transglycosylase SLT domain-containing protein [Virgibacillus halodenitrificans]